MKPLEKMLAILAICVTLLGPFAAAGGEAEGNLDTQAPDAWIDASAGDCAELPERPCLESPPLRAELELDEDLDQDPAAPSAMDDGQTVASRHSSWETRTTSQGVTLGARSARGPPAA